MKKAIVYGRDESGRYELHIEAKNEKQLEAKIKTIRNNTRDSIYVERENDGE